MPDSASLDDYRWLVGEEAAGVLASIADEPDSALVSVAARLRKNHSTSRTHLIVEQATLRHRARVKFDAADRMFFTPLGLQQATDQRIARYKADALPESLPIADLCCGIGGDLIAMARKSPIVGVDHDPISALFAEANLEALLPEGQGRVSCEDVDQFSLADFEAWHIDPDRRPNGRRTTQPEFHQPPPSTINHLLESCPNAMLKLAPAAEIPGTWSRKGEREWVTSGRECRQQIVYFGSLARESGLRRATVLVESKSDVDRSTSDDTASNSLDSHTFVGHPNRSMPYAPKVRCYLYEPDPSILAAGLSAAFAEHLELAAPNVSVPYFTSDQVVTNPLVSRFEVEMVLPFDLKRVKRALTEQNVGRVEIKKRAIDLVPEHLAQKLKLKGDTRAVLFVFPIGRHITAVIAKRPGA